MGKKQTTKNTYTHVATPDTPDILAARQAVQNVDLRSPIVNAYGQAEREMQDEAFYDQEMPEGARARVKAGRLFNLRTQKGAALSQAAGQEHQIKTSGMMNLANMTRSQLVNDSSTTRVRDPWGTVASIVGAGAQMASAIPTGGSSLAASAGPATGAPGGLT